MKEFKFIEDKVNKISKDFSVTCDPKAFQNLSSQAQSQNKLWSAGRSDLFFIVFDNDIYVKAMLKDPSKPQGDYYLENP